ncbi:MAG: hypothetical protein AAFN93_05680 [Bacteroidota bacterium]
MTIKDIFNNPNLSFKDNRIYRIFNLIVLSTILLVVGIAVFLLTINAISSFWICIGEVIFFSVLLYGHVKGHFIITRYIFYLFAIITTAYGSLYHGENGGFDFLFLAICLSPVLFFEQKVYVTSLFILVLGAFITVKVLYNYIEPVMPLERQIIPYYANILISSLLLYYGYGIFKKEHLKYEEQITNQRNQINDQKIALSKVKDQLEALLEDRTKRIEKQDRNIAKYAYLNSHRVRSPLARILGLVNLTAYEDLNDEEKRQYYFDQLKSNAKELDTILTEINQILDNSRDT